MTGRRGFLIGCAGLASVPALAGLASAKPSGRSALPNGAHTSFPASGDDGTAAASIPTNLRIVGWEAGGESDNGAWLHVNSSWRVDWR